jgi:hypothetical protein
MLRMAEKKVCTYKFVGAEAQEIKKSLAVVLDF